jgi:hypothetical protein
MADAMHTRKKESRVNTMGNIVGMAEGIVVAKYLVSNMQDLSARLHGCYMYLQQIRPQEGIFSDPHAAGRHTDNHHHPLWAVCFKGIPFSLGYARQT